MNKQNDDDGDDDDVYTCIQLSQSMKVLNVIIHVGGLHVYARVNIGILETCMQCRFKPVETWRPRT